MDFFEGFFAVVFEGRRIVFEMEDVFEADLNVFEGLNVLKVKND